MVGGEEDVSGEEVGSTVDAFRFNVAGVAVDNLEERVPWRAFSRLAWHSSTRLYIDCKVTGSVSVIYSVRCWLNGFTMVWV